MKRFLTVLGAVAGMFTLTYLTFFYLAVARAFVVPILLALGYLVTRRVAGASLPVLAAAIGVLGSGVVMLGSARNTQ